jgi:hypothetical protein
VTNAENKRHDLDAALEAAGWERSPEPHQGGDRRIVVMESGFYPVETESCDLCNKPAEELSEVSWELQDRTRGMYCVCERCRALLIAAEVLLDNEVTDENEVITTMAVAAGAGMAWTTVGNQSPEDVTRMHPGLSLSRATDGKPLVRMLPVDVREWG